MRNTERDKAIRKIEGAIDRMIDLQDMGLNDDRVMRVLEMLNALLNHVREIP